VAARSKAYTGPAPDDQDAQHGQQEAAEPAAGGDAAGCRSGASNAGSTPVFDPEALADYRRCVADPDTVHAMCEDYRPAPASDDEADAAVGRWIACPDPGPGPAATSRPAGSTVVAVWRRWADRVSGHGIDADRPPEGSTAKRRRGSAA
jgi:hypothetical protein